MNLLYVLAISAGLISQPFSVQETEVICSHEDVVCEGELSLPVIDDRDRSMTQIIYSVAREEGLSEAVADRFVAIATCESGLNPRAKSSTNDHGLLQIHAPLWTNFFGVTTEELYDPELNVQLAVKIYKRSGSFEPWACNKLI